MKNYENLKNKIRLKVKFNIDEYMKKRKFFQSKKINVFNHNQLFGITIRNKITKSNKISIKIPLRKKNWKEKKKFKFSSKIHRKTFYRKDSKKKDKKLIKKEKINYKKKLKDEIKLFKEIEGNKKLIYQLNIKKINERIINDKKKFEDNRLDFIKIKVI